MDMSDANTAITIVCGVAIVVGIFGTVVPFVPGLLLSWAGVLLWAIFAQGGGGGKWLTVGIVTVLALAGTLMKYVLPGRKLQRDGVPNMSLLAGGLLGIVGFFVVPVVGLFLGFVAGIFLAELARLKSSRLAWPSTWRGIKAVGFSMMIEIFAGLCILAVWVWALVLST